MHFGMRRTCSTIFALVVAVRVLAGQTPTASQVPADSEIQKILADRVDVYRQSVGIVVGVVDSKGRRIVSYGKLKQGDSRPLDGDTIFEIGSITKVFTSLLLTSMVERGEVALSDPAANYLPPAVQMPEREGRQIELQDLATHTSGLPRMPTNVQSKDPEDPFADYSVRELYEFLSTYRLPRDVGSRFEYSNLGSALLGHVLARRAGTDYGALVRARITEPLGMRSTSTTLTPEMKARLAVGHAYMLEPTPNWGMDALAGAGALHSTANDLLTFLAANLGYVETPLAPAMASMLRIRRDTGQGRVLLAWFSDTHEGIEVITHTGRTGGYTSFIGYEPKSRTGVVVLSNAGSGAGMEDIGVHLLNPKVPLLGSRELTPDKARREIAIEPKLLEEYVGRYRFPSNQVATVTSEKGHLCLQGEGDIKIAFYPESSTEFFARLTDAQIRFNSENGRVTELIFSQSGSTSGQHVRRID
jgi:serine-type D-Ala-D-Ala carboxypeptidase/endopeptidase